MNRKFSGSSIIFVLMQRIISVYRQEKAAAQLFVRNVFEYKTTLLHIHSVSEK